MFEELVFLQQMVPNRRDQSQNKSYLKEHVNPVCACVFWKEWLPCTGLFLFAAHLTKQRCLDQRHDNGKEVTHKLPALSLILAVTQWSSYPLCFTDEETESYTKGRVWHS